MRFIRDIIKEKRIAAESEPEAFAPDAPLDTLVLTSPVMPGAPAVPAMDETNEAPEAESAAADTFAPAIGNTVEQAAGTDDYDDDDEEVQALLRAIEEERAKTEEPVAEDETVSPAAGDDSDDVSDEDFFAAMNGNDAGDLPDPFDKLRDTQPAASAPSRTVSPLRRPVNAVPPAATPEAQAPAPEAPVDGLTPLADAMEAPVQMPSPAKGRGSARSGRVKTRLLGFSAGSMEKTDPFDKKPNADNNFPVGWLVVVSEKGRGASFTLQDGVTKVGRGTDQTVCLNFGDNSISRDNHISIAFDEEQNKFFIGHSGKTNLVRLNNVPLLSTEALTDKDLIRLGETTLRFIAFCADDFSWNASEEQAVKHA